MAAIYSNGGNRWNILGFNFTKRDALSSLYKISMSGPKLSHYCHYLHCHRLFNFLLTYLIFLLYPHSYSGNKNTNKKRFHDRHQKLHLNKEDDTDMNVPRLTPVF